VNVVQVAAKCFPFLACRRRVKEIERIPDGGGAGGSAILTEEQAAQPEEEWKDFSVKGERTAPLEILVA